MMSSHVVIDSCGFRHEVTGQLTDALDHAKRIENRGQLAMRIVAGSKVVLEGQALRDALEPTLIAAAE